MPFVKLDVGILDSTLWVERECREMFITALLLAEPFELRSPAHQLEVRSLEKTGFVVPPGWYGFVHAAGVGIARRAMLDDEPARTALEKLGSPDPESRSEDFEGRRMVRVDGGFIILNFIKYREKDASNSERQKRWRLREKQKATVTPLRNEVTPLRDTFRNQAEAEAYTGVERPVTSKSKASSRNKFNPGTT